MNWSREQEAALDAVGHWVASPDGKQIFRLFGYAGTGKTTLAKHLAESCSGAVIFASFTGKAASVMRQRGCPEATTLHSLIYHPVEKNREKLRELECRLALLRARSRNEENLEADIGALEKEIEDEKAALRRPAFDLNQDSPLAGAALLVVDECSMVDDRLGEDVLRFGTPVLVLGDPAQLPPVRGSGFFTSVEPDIVLTEIHRQARDNPIVAMATTVREGGSLTYGSYGESRVVPRGEFDKSSVPENAQILVGRNETRRRANAARREARGFPIERPVPGDRLVCLRNNHEVGLLNGGIWSITEAVDLGDEFIDMVVRDEERSLGVRAHLAPFRGQEVPFWTRREAEEFDYGYALTCHKAQGSQWPEILVVDESGCFRQDARRWLYTAITRAQDKVTVVR